MTDDDSTDSEETADEEHEDPLEAIPEAPLGAERVSKGGFRRR